MITKDIKPHTQKLQNKKQATMDLQNNQKTISKMSVVNLYLFIIILNIKGLNSPIKDRVDKHIKNIYISKDMLPT